MSPESELVMIYTDGACEPNPGPGGYGIVIIEGGRRKEISGGFRKTTNNRMEITAAIKGLEALDKPSEVRLYSDSQYLIKAMTLGWVERWKKANWKRNRGENALNVDLWKVLMGLCQKHKVEFIWVKGHSGNRENERCDQLSYAALKGRNLAVDIGYRAKTTNQSGLGI